MPAQVNENGPAASASQPPREGTFLFLSDLLGLRILGPRGERVGTLVDLLAEAAGAYPRVKALRVRTGLPAEL